MTRTLYRPDTPAEADRRRHEFERDRALSGAYRLRECLEYCAPYSRSSFENRIASLDLLAAAHAKKLKELTE